MAIPSEDCDADKAWSGTVDERSATVGSPGTNPNPVPSVEHTKPRALWAGKVEFLLSAVGFAVGLGNIWRFPYLCYVNGGGAFLVPYVLMLAFAGLPLFFLELAIGQYASLGPITIWRACPLFKGLGYAMVLVNLMVAIYYNAIIGFTLFYFFASFTSQLPWMHCHNWWNTDYCSTDRLADKGDVALNVSAMWNASMTTVAGVLGGNTTLPTSGNASALQDQTIYRSPAQEYWELYVLGMKEDTSIANIGPTRWHVSLCLFLSWIVVFMCIYKGIKSIGKVVYFTAIFPYVVLVILFFRGVTLSGAGLGISYYLKPDFAKMAHVKVWKDAAVQILYSLGPGFGSLLTMGSYNKFNNNCLKDAITVTVINCATSVFAGFVIFSVIGHMALTSGMPVDKVADTGPGLAFVVYPEGLALMPGAPFWSVCFFFMLFLLGLDSQFAGIECIVTALVDEFPKLMKYKIGVTATTCILLFLLGLPCATQGGMFVIQLLDKFSTSFPLLIIVLLETVAISWVYGYKRFLLDIEIMIGFRPNKYWSGCWLIVTPLILLCILVFSCIEYDGVEYQGQRYPAWAEGLGWVLSLSSLVMIPVWMLIKLGQCILHSQVDIRALFSGTSAWRALNLRSLIEPTPAWGPALPENRQQQATIHLSLHESQQPTTVDSLQEPQPSIHRITDLGSHGSPGELYTQSDSYI